MIETYKYLVNKTNFKTLQKPFDGIENGVQINLTDDFKITLVPDEESWNSCQDVHIYLTSLRFSKIMFHLFNDKKNNYDVDCLAHSYLPRKLRKDNSGCLAQGMAGLESENGTTFLFNGGIKYDIKEFVNLCNDMNNKNKIFEKLYYSKFNEFIVVIESVWVYIYLCLEIGMSLFEILNSFKNSDIQSKAIQCKLKKEIDYNILEVFENAYNSAKIINNEGH
ncbi:MAG: hypothetical protein AB8B80_15515 [Marinicellaceae bacterium]